MSFVAHVSFLASISPFVEDKIANTPYSWMMTMVDPTIRILLIILTLAVALAVGLYLRVKLVRRLARTVLDNWVVQTLGVLIIIPPLILVAPLIPIIYGWDFYTLVVWWYIILDSLHINPGQLPGILWNLIQSVVLIALGIGIARTVRTLTIRHLGENRIDINIRTLIGRIFFFTILFIVFIWILSIWQISLGVPVTAVGFITAALIVAIQDILKDLVAGFYILVERPFFIGNVISTATYVGRVEDIQLRATKLRLVSGEEVTIPNSLVFGGTVVNNSYYGERRATVAITIPQEEFHQVETTEQIIQACKSVERVIPKPEPSILFSSYAENKITLTLYFWFATEQPSTINDVMYALTAILPHAELSLKEPVGIF